ncbi:MAG: lipoprotein-releasing ABC transporter permease subunit [Deltaproteobacteria bacterium]|nr:lipoprotein-releasing ABC transporter permease subunit [Deltaproteobacteria bacterium]
MSFEFFICRRYLRTKHKQAFISLITILSIAGITIGVMALVIVIAVMTGAESDFRSMILGVESHVVLMRRGHAFTDFRKTVSEVTEIDGVETASPYVYTQIMLRSSSGVSGAVLKGIDPGSKAREIKNFSEPALRKCLTTASMEEKAGFKPGIILGKNLALNLSVMKGDSLYMISPKGMLSPVGHIPVMKRFTVTGIFNSGMYEYDSSLAYIHFREAQKIMRMGDAVSGIGIRVKDIYNAGNIAHKIVQNLNSKHPGYLFWAKDWMQMNHNLFSALKLEKKAMFIILSLIVLVAAFNISSTLIMMVMSKTKDIAILKAMGATDKSIKKIFVLHGMIIGVIGTMSGIILGTAACWILKHYKIIELPGDVYYFTTLPVQLAGFDVFLIAASSLAISFLSTLYPAKQASKQNPAEAIRYG